MYFFKKIKEKRFIFALLSLYCLKHSMDRYLPGDFGFGPLGRLGLDCTFHISVVLKI